MAREPDRKVDESEFLDVAMHPAEASVVRKALERLVTGRSGLVLKQMRQEVSSGCVGLLPGCWGTRQVGD